MEEQANQFKVVLKGKSYTTGIPQRGWTEHITELKGGVKGMDKDPATEHHGLGFFQSLVQVCPGR
jgi:hypothetical protein